MKSLFYSIILLFLVTSAHSQGGLAGKLRLKNKFLTFERTRFSAAINFNGGAARLNPKVEDQSGWYGALGFMFDVYSPLSTVGFSTGIGFKVLTHKLGTTVNDQFVGDSITVTGAEIPFFLRFKIGAVGSAHRLILMPGVAYNLASDARIENSRYATFENKDIVQNYLDYRFQIGWEFLVGRDLRQNYKGKYIADARTRIILLGGISYTNDLIYDTTYQNDIPIEYKDTFNQFNDKSPINYYVGFNVYFTLGEWKHLGNSMIQELTN